MSTFWWVLVCVLPCTAIAVGAGYGLARQLFKQQREEMLGTLVATLKKTADLKDDVNGNSSKLRTVSRTITAYEGGDDFQDLQDELLSQITDLVESNQKLEDVCATRRPP